MAYGVGIVVRVLVGMARVVGVMDVVGIGGAALRAM